MNLSLRFDEHFGDSVNGDTPNSTVAGWFISWKIDEKKWMMTGEDRMTQEPRISWKILMKWRIKMIKMDNPMIIMENMGVSRVIEVPPVIIHF